MSKNKIEMANKDGMFDKSQENEIIEEISKQKFLVWLDKNGLTAKQLKAIFDEKRISSVEQNRFNVILRKAKKEINVSIIDSVLYLESSFNKFKKIFSYLDNDTKNILKEELAKKHKIKIDRNELYKILG